jgi:hypothetical protein
MPKINSTAVRNLRREQAEERQRKYDALSIDEKLELAKSRRGESTREITRLLKRKLAREND